MARIATTATTMLLSKIMPMTPASKAISKTGSRFVGIRSPIRTSHSRHLSSVSVFTESGS